MYAGLREVVTVSRDDVVLQKPEDVRFQVPVFHTPNACPGAVTAYLLRRIAYRAGAYAPGIQEILFHELNTSRDGGTLEKVEKWFGSRVSSLHELGYRLQFRHIATPTLTILEWVRGGRGYRGAMIPTTYLKLHPRGSAGQDVVDAGSRRQDHRRSRRERLQRREAPRVAIAQDHEDVGGRVGVLQLRIGQRGAGQRHTARLLAGADPGGQPVGVGGVFVV